VLLERDSAAQWKLGARTSNEACASRRGFGVRHVRTRDAKGRSTEAPVRGGLGIRGLGADAEPAPRAGLRLELGPGASARLTTRWDACGYNPDVDPWKRAGPRPADGFYLPPPSGRYQLEASIPLLANKTRTVTASVEVR
jgi:hypothetical protein